MESCCIVLQWCSTPHGRLCSCTGALLAFLRAEALSQGAFSFVIAGQSLGLTIIRKLCTDSFQHKCRSFTPLLEPSFCFPPGIPCRVCGWKGSFGNLPVPSRQQEPANTSGETGDVLPQQTESAFSPTSAVMLFCWTCCWGLAVSKTEQ